MTDYMDAARNCEVLRDGEAVNAAEECRRLSELLEAKPLTAVVLYEAFKSHETAMSKERDKLEELFQESESLLDSKDRALEHLRDAIDAMSEVV